MALANTRKQAKFSPHKDDYLVFQKLVALEKPQASVSHVMERMMLEYIEANKHKLKEKKG